MKARRCVNCPTWTRTFFCIECWRAVFAGVVAAIVADVAVRGISWLMK